MAFTGGNERTNIVSSDDCFTCTMSRDYPMKHECKYLLRKEKREQRDEVSVPILGCIDKVKCTGEKKHFGCNNAKRYGCPCP